ncbi:hypothetical protein EV672_110116 [Aquabacterium commune]|uniref:Uncharacterized protein n=1 Tax=Aquabacterium commune TaxID=70586 RepID=A0A4R6R4S5_9BURK|nr:hypothetical protein [Aquabacterium commune]TDP80901.1 hypothetical protein EV672_110116 [Aquabacterium commune]
MEQTVDFDSPSSGRVGAYRQNAFYIRMSSFYDLDPAIDQPPSVAVAFHAHEYVHFLHNASTTAGLAYLSTNLILLRILAGGTDEEGYFGGLNKLREMDQMSFQDVSAVMLAQLGTSVPTPPLPHGAFEWRCGAPAVTVSDGIPTVTAQFWQDQIGSIAETKSASISVGLSFITEGVAYEVEREMRWLSGTPEVELDNQVNFFPYLAFRVLVRSWSGRDLNAREFILIGVAALASSFAGDGLMAICNALKSSDRPVSQVLDAVRANFHHEAATVMAILREQQENLVPGDVTWNAMREYIALAEAGVAMRERLWAPELVFLEGSPTPEDFRGRVGAMLDCLVLQEKPAKELALYWIGPGKAAVSDIAIQHLGSLQSALHFSQLHLRSDGGAYATEDLSHSAIACPFSGGCQSEKDDGEPRECKTAPWKRFTPSQPNQSLCWYAAGVKTLKKKPNSLST